MPLLRPDSAEGLERRVTIALRNGVGGFLETAMCELGQVGKSHCEHIESASSPLTAPAAGNPARPPQWANRPLSRPKPSTERKAGSHPPAAPPVSHYSA